MNVHQIRWLCHSRENTPEGYRLQEFCGQYDFREYVRTPTRNQYLLDLILTDVENHITSFTLTEISDHLCTAISFSLKTTTAP